MDHLFNPRAGALARSLKANGVRRGDRVALYLPNIPAFILAYLAGQKAGAIVVSINSMFKAEEVKYIVQHSGARVLFVDPELIDPRKNVKADTVQYKSSREKVFACGDMRRGQSLVVWAIREGRQCARAVDLYLTGKTELPR